MSSFPALRIERFSLALALTLAIALILSSGLALDSYLDYANFKRAHTQLAISRILVPAQDLRHLIETGMDFGLSLSQLTTLQERLQELLEIDPELLAIGIYDSFDQTLFQVAHPAVALPQSLPSLRRQAVAAKGYWQVALPDRYLLGMAFENSFKQPAGSLVMVYDRARIDEPIVVIGKALLHELALTLTVMILLVALGIHRLVRPLHRELHRIASAVVADCDLPDAAPPAGERPTGNARHLGSLSDQVSLLNVAVNQELARIAQAARGAELADETPRSDRSLAPPARLTGLDVFNQRMLALALALILSGISVTSYLNLQDFRREFAPSLHRKAETLGNSLSRTLIFLNERGIEPGQLRGLGDDLARIRASNPEVGYLALVAPTGAIVASAGTIPDQARALFRQRPPDLTAAAPVTQSLAAHLDTRTVVMTPDGVIGQIHIGQERRFIDRQIAEIWWDLATVILVAMLIAFELLLFAIAFLVHVPLSSVYRLAETVRAGEFSARIAIRSNNALGQLAAALNARLDRLDQVCRNALSEATSTAASTLLTRLRDRYSPPHGTHRVAEDRLILIRWPFFLLIFAESLSLSFFPLYVRTLHEPMVGWSSELLIGLPISVFMLVWALSLPAAGTWSDRVGRRRAFLTGALVTALGLALTGTAQELWELILWRSLTALGYGIVFITAQSYVVDYTPPTQRTRGMAMFLVAFFGGSLCGAAIGGILAERLGYAPVFWLAALLALIAAAVAGKFLQAPTGATVAPRRAPMRLADLGYLLLNPRFLAVTALTAIPAKLILTGFLYYAMPLYLSKLSLNASDVGRVMMTYGLAMILLSPVIGYLADVWGKRTGFVAIGGLLAALSILLVALQPTVWVAVIGIVLLGAAHAIGVSPQLTLVMDVSGTASERIGTGAVMGIFRLLERIGNILGPLVVALLIGAYGFSGAFVALGLYALASVTLFGLVWAILAQRDRRRKATPAALKSPGTADASSGVSA